MSRAPFIAACITITLVTTTVRAGDWPQLLGPERNGVAATDEKLIDWPADGPKVRWQREVGPGYASPAIADGRVVLFHSPNHTDTVECLELATAKVLWTFSYPANFRDKFGFDHGPRATPTIDAVGRRVYTYGSQGMLHCLDFDTGKLVWSDDMQKHWDAPAGWFGRACSPLVEGDLVILNVGGTGGIVAYDKKSGSVKWRDLDQEPSYASPVMTTVNDHRYAVFFTRAGVVVIDPKNGRVHGEVPWRPQIDASVNAANPVVFDDKVFVSTSYDRGAMLAQIDNDGVHELWASQAMSNHYATSLYREGYIYGLDGRQESGSLSLVCLDVKTGKAVWHRDRLPAGSLIRVGHEMLMLSEDGELTRLIALPSDLKFKAKATVLGDGIRAYPALSHGLLVARDKTKMVCLEVGKGSELP
ncbi:MAG: PQQ-binding-like beta-propeller repeat protein [Phycisphaera sp.]|nr:PQQ-binding-like beta-propeller repeat protein [Phycisphaera sp.]